MTGGIAEFLQDIKSAFMTRVSNPLIGAFSLSWVLVNYRLIFVLFSDKSIDWRLAYIDTYLYGDSLELISRWFVIPFFMAFLYIWLLPSLSMPVYRFVLQRQLEMVDIKRSVHGAKLITHEEREKALAEATAEYDRATALKEEADLKLRESEIAVRKAEAQIAERDLAARNIEDDSRRKVAQLSKGMNELRLAMIDERARGSERYTGEERSKRLRDYLMSQSFEYVVRTGEGAGSGLITFGADGVILPATGLESILISWEYEEPWLVIGLGAQNASIRFRLLIETGEFIGRSSFGEARMSPTRKSEPLI